MCGWECSGCWRGYCREIGGARSALLKCALEGPLVGWSVSKLDGPTEAVSFNEHAYLYEHSVIKLNSGSDFPTLMQLQIQIPECTA